MNNTIRYALMKKKHKHASCIYTNEKAKSIRIEVGSVYIVRRRKIRVY